MKKTKKDKGIAGLMLFVGWLVFILLALIFYFYFSKGFMDFFNKKSKSGADAQKIYEVNKYPAVNSLIEKYFTAISECDEKTLKSLVSNPAEFDDMTNYEKRAKVITGYENIICYTIPGYQEGDLLVYVIANLTFSDVTKINSKPLDISYFYLKKNYDDYFILNVISDENINEYIEAKYKNDDIQNLYKSVKENIDSCAATDSAFAELYNKIY
ncbi:MAG: hypothetical protein NC225_00580 [Clostridium sp.]|nr:hypothetical protein [Clostridium sp.]MCM1397955.1 hypothetical protein [Clostridium sp.]MCM1459408.1 hypothetical protein [Bacteroides sp.]